MNHKVLIAFLRHVQAFFFFKRQNRWKRVVLTKKKKKKIKKARMLIVKGHEESFSYWPLAISFWGPLLYTTVGLFSLIVFCWSPLHQVIIFLKVVFSFFVARGGELASISLYPITIRQNCLTYAFLYLIISLYFSLHFVSCPSELHITCNWYHSWSHVSILHHFPPFPGPFLLCGKS